MYQPCVLALGFFDGVHLGHGGLLKKTREVADRLGLPAAALTMDNHPDTLVFGKKMPLLNTLEERKYLMHTLYGIDEVRLLHFDRATMAQSWQDFVKSTLQEQHRAAFVVCGHDYRFGAHAEGTPERLRALCEALGIGFACIPEITLDGETVSSTLIRSLLEQGEAARAVRFLGHPHLLSGTVVSGQRLGRTLGIPTANVIPAEGILIPRFGVYAARAYFDGKEQLAVVNIGVRPTVHGDGVTVEPWILDFDGDLYGHNLRLELVDFLRPEKKFASLEALKAEVHRNAEQTRALLRAVNGEN